MSDGELFSSDNLATPLRTVAGVLRCFGVLGVDASQAEAIFAGVGLPRRALVEPDFPILLETELAAILAALRRLEPGRSALTLLFERRARFGLESLGVLGMAMRHAPTTREAYRALLSFPGLSWGHTRLIARVEGDMLACHYTMAPPATLSAPAAEIARLVEFCTVMDMVSGTRNNEDLVSPHLPTVAVVLPFDRPGDWERVAPSLPYPVQFNASEAKNLFPASLGTTALPNANALAFNLFYTAARRLSEGFAQDITLTERVTRLLWAYCPAMSRREMAQRLHLSERSLTRRLSAESASYAGLLAQVQAERAQSFLRNSALSVAEIGYRMGYSDPAAFSRAFSSWTGAPPSDWRRRAIAAAH